MLPKLVAVAFQPLSVFFGLVLAAILLGKAGRTRAAARLAGLAFVFLWVASMPRAARALIFSIEGQTPPVAVADSPKADAIVLLGGALGARLPPRLSVELVDASDRVLHAARLYRAGKAPVVIASGGRLPWAPEAEVESDEMAALLVEWGVPSAAIVRESGSSTTRENATGTASLLSERKLKSVLLVTSALHMPRALAAFRAAGVDATPAPTDFTAVQSRTTPFDFLPDAGALHGTSAAVRELVGLVYYRMRGWA